MTTLNVDHFVKARAAFCRQLQASRAKRFGREIKGPQFDDEVMSAPRVEDPPAPPIAFHMIYRDAKGDYSGRVVTLRNLKHELNEIRLTAFCHWRSAMRQFVASRVVEATDLATGEVHEDGMEYFMRHPLLEGLSADGLANMSLETLALQECRDEIIILSFVAAADGDFELGESDEIVRHVMNRVPEEGLSESEIRRRTRHFVPDERAFDQALNRMCAGGGDARSLMWSMRHVIDADGEVDPEEAAFAHEVGERLRAAGRL
jgi:hypothetical protein